MKKIASLGTALALWALVLMLSTYVLLIYPGVDAIDRFFIRTSAVLGRLDAPAWVQAVGSIAAILVAIFMSWSQRRSDKAERLHREDAAGLIASASLLAMIPGQIMTLRVLEEAIPSVNAANSCDRAARYLFMMQALQIPSDEQLMNLQPVLPNIAGLLASACSSYRQLITLLLLINDKKAASPEWVAEQLSALADAYKETRKKFDAAIIALRMYVEVGIE